MHSFLTRRAGIWHYARRVPTAFAELDRRGIVKQSTHVRIGDDPRGLRAGKVALRINGDLESYWRSLVDGQSADAHARYAAARKRARAYGFDYVPAADIAQRPLDELVDRLERLVSNGRTEDAGAVSAVLGGEPPPPLMLAGMFDMVESLTRAELSDMSADQLRRWRNPKKRALANLIRVIGNKPLHQISRSDALDFREWWEAKILAGRLDADTANKDIGHLNKMFTIIERRHRLGLKSPFSDLRIEGRADNSRAAFTVDFVQGVILADGALADLNEEARRIVYLVAETGLRLSEATNLTASTIILDHDVPHVRVRPDGRRMKTGQSERDVPLVGVALAAMQAQPNGFPRYRDKAAGLSALVNKYLGAHDMRPTDNHSLYSLRHTFEDRLTAVEAPEKLIAALMGHKYSRPKYGSGPSLAQKREWLEKIAFVPPVAV